ncbi:hypothetical protein EV356DRAFT_483172 [Viridothelium virens]|uniref:VLRF1 domain-containing protein n=1 Tax=Viridothelium virens TaxID=1048519 RepID=A0A6A6HCP5_VIRVR|nr:hypothetical protein EV356DRAFT_483172 [Viridothelium virens]
MAQLGDSILRRPLYVFDLPEEILATIQPKAEHTSASSQEESKEIPSYSSVNEISQSGDTQPSTTSATSCSLCGLRFANLQEQRSHVRSDLHGYNLKLKARGLMPVSETDFERFIDDLSESISGSDSDDSETDSDEGQTNGSKGKDSTLSALLKKQANISAPEEDQFGSRKRKRGTGKPPLLWFTTPKVPENAVLGIYRAIFSEAEQQNEAILPDIVRQKQLAPEAPPKPAQELEGGGVAIPKAATKVPHYFLCMIGGGHFAGMVISLAPKKGKTHTGMDERSATVLAHKTFHRYTTRRKQGGSQAANDSAKGAAHSAGSSLRRYNEAALTSEVRQLLSEWKDLIDTAELLFIRATGSTNRRTLFGPYDGQVLTHDDPRNRGFPFSTRRATQAELMRSFVELTRVKVSDVDPTAQSTSGPSLQSPKPAPKTPSKAPLPTAHDEADQEATLHTIQLTSLIRRSRAPALLTYLSTHSLPASFTFHPPSSHHHAPTPLHLAASLGSPAVISALLLKAAADPSVRNGEGKTAFEIAGDRAARDAFRTARGELGEEAWDWDAAGVPGALSRKEVEARADADRKEREKDGREEKERREREVEKLRAVEKDKEQKDREGKMGKGRSLGVMAEREKAMSAQEKREEEGRGMTPEMRARLERERRARAAEERIKRMQGGAAGGAGR